MVHTLPTYIFVDARDNQGLGLEIKLEDLIQYLIDNNLITVTNLTEIANIQLYLTEVADTLADFESRIIALE